MIVADRDSHSAQPHPEVATRRFSARPLADGCEPRRV